MSNIWEHYLVDMARIRAYESIGATGRNKAISAIRHMAKEYGLIFKETNYRVKGRRGMVNGWGAFEDKLLVSKLKCLQDWIDDYRNCNVKLRRKTHYNKG